MKRTVSFVIALLMTFSCLAFFASCSSGKIAMEYEGYSFSEGMYLYWMKNWKGYYVQNYSDVVDSEEFWQALNGAGVTNAAYITEQIETRIKYYLVAQKLFDEYGLKLDQDTLDSIDEDIDSAVEYYGSKGAFNDYLREEYGINISTLKTIYTAEEKYTAVYDHLYNNTSGVKTATPAELEAYYREYYVRVKYVMFFKDVKYAYDEDGNIITDSSGRYTFEDLTEEEKQEVVETVNSVYEDVKNGGDIGIYMSEYNTEFGYNESDYPNGFYISADDYVTHTALVTSAALEMDIGEVRLIDGDACYYVLQKFDLIDNAYAATPDSNQFSYLLSYCNNEKFSIEFNGYADDVITYTDITSQYTVNKV